MVRAGTFGIPRIDWHDDPQERLRAEVFVWVCAVFFLVIAVGSAVGFAIDGVSARRLPSILNLFVLTACLSLSYRQRSIDTAAKLFVVSLAASAMVYTYQTGGVTGYGISFMLTMPFVAQLFSTRAVSVGLYAIILGYLWFLLFDHGFHDQTVVLRTVFLSLTLTGLLGISLAFAVMAQRASAQLERERRKADAANQAKSAFLANTSHEVRTPLNGILGMAQILRQDPLEPEQRERVDVILDSGQTLLSVLNDVLDLSKIEAGRLELSPTPHALAPAIRKGLKLWEGQAAERGLDLALHIAPNADRVLVFDPVRARQCLSNLVSNALKFTHEGGVRVSVDCVPHGPAVTRVTIVVSDSGIGLSPEAMARLFKPFSQADKEVSARYGGTGLGLNISRELAVMMGGDITVDSVEGQGSTFTFSFVADQATEPSDRSAAPAGLPQDEATRQALAVRDIRVLLADDNAVNRKVARAFLRPITGQVTEAVHGLDALQQLRTAPDAFDLVLLDMNMPVLDGPETIAAIRSEAALWCDIPVIAVTADAMSGDRERYLAMGLSGYISKPVEQNQMLAEINRALSSAPPRKAVALAG